MNLSSPECPSCIQHVNIELHDQRLLINNQELSLRAIQLHVSADIR